MAKYEIKTEKGHILSESEHGILLIDTGSPASFHADGEIILGGEHIPVPRSVSMVNSEYLSKQIGTSIKGMVGMDIIRKHQMSMDVAGGVIEFGGQTEGWTEVPSRDLEGCPIVSMTVQGKPASIILDTGAPVSYIDPSFTRSLPVADTVTDFSPLLGEGSFEVNRYDTEASFAGKSFSIRLGHLPQRLSAVLSLIGANGVFGIDALKHFKVMFTKDEILVR